MIRLGLSVVLFSSLFIIALRPDCRAEPRLDTIKLPPGFSISLFATGVEGARSMTRGESGTIYVGGRATGKIFALPDADGDYKADRVITIAKDLEMPNGVAFKDGSLYAGEVPRIIRFDGIDGRLDNPPPPVTVKDGLPPDHHHGWRYLRFGPDNLLYVGIGAPCNICTRPDERYATISRMKPDGSEFEVFARGIRNTVGFDWEPSTKQLWFTDNGRDMLGDDTPPDELNRAPRPGMHFGFPYCHGASIADPEFNKGRGCADFTPAARELGPHVAALGMRFYDGAMFPDDYHDDILIAEHGSWNRATPLGYRITRVKRGSGGLEYSTFAEGWLQDGKPWGRPVDLLILPDGSLLVSDDFAGVIYRIVYNP